MNQTMKVRTILFVFCAMLMALPVGSLAQGTVSVYGDRFKADVKMDYVYSLDEAQKKARKQKKLIFFNCFVDWAMPCHGMNMRVFSNQEFCDYMNKTFVNLFMDMNTPEGKKLAEQYGVSSYAHYLILDAKGNLVHRIAGGAEVKEFKEKVDLALKPETSLTGATAKIQSGNYTRQDMYNYLRAIYMSGSYAKFKEEAKDYIVPLKFEDYARKENWMFIYLAVENRESPCYSFMLDNKPLFLKEIPEKEVNGVFEYALFPPINAMAMGDAPYNAEMMEVYGQEMRKVNLPDTCVTKVYYDIAKLRGTRKYLELVDYLHANKRLLSVYRTNLEMSLNLLGMNQEERKAVVAYLKSSAEDFKGSSVAGHLNDLVKRLEAGDGGIKFEKASFADLLAKAKQENKLIFLDCYTVWCGPCRMMANTVFTDAKVGDFFNAHFINAKIDMEKGEGVELAKRYQVDAYPTMMFIDGDGKVVHRFTGGRKAPALLKIAEDVLKK